MGVKRLKFQVVLFPSLLITLLLYFMIEYLSAEVKPYMLDDAFHQAILYRLREEPLGYYAIYDEIYRKMHVDVSPALFRFPLLFYLWLLVPHLAEIKWLYFAFTIPPTFMCYIMASSLTGSRLMGFITAAYVRYFLQQPFFLMFEYWAISVFLVGFAFFVMRRIRVATILMILASLLKEIFALFPFVAFLYCAARRRVQEAVVWGLSSLFIGIIYLIHGWLSNSLGKQSILFLATFNVKVLPNLFESFFYRTTPLPTALSIILALVGMLLLTKDARFITYLSFFVMPLLMLTAAPNPPYTFSIETAPPSRWLALQITLVNTFWPLGIYTLIKERHVINRFVRRLAQLLYFWWRL